MKKLFLFLVVVLLLFVTGYSQTIHSGTPDSFKVVPSGTRAPKGMVNVTLQVGANIPNSNGYVMFLDPTATTYGAVFPSSGYIAYDCELPPGFIDAFAFKIPADVEPVCTSPNIVFDNSITIQITSGIYDYIIGYPMSDNEYWSVAPAPNGRQHNYAFEEGYHYTFAIDYSPGPKLDLIITEEIPEPNAPAAVSNLTITPDDTEDFKAVISWINPTKTNGGETLTELTSVKIYDLLDATLIYTNSNPVIGGEESFTITVPDQGSYFYMVVGENSAGVGTAGTTTIKFCSKISSFPYNEGFETSVGTSFPVCWEQEFVSGTTFWEAIPYYYGTPGTTPEGINKAYFFSTKRGDKTKLITAPIDLSAVEHPVLNFWHTQRMWYADMDKLRIYYKNSSDGEWNLLTEYITEVYDWTKRNIALPNKSSDYYIAFEGEAQYANGIQLDDIRIVDMEGMDGAAIQLFGVTTPMENEPYVYKAQIQNVAGKTLTGYTVKLVDDQNNVLDINEEGEDIVSMESKMISLRYTPTSTGTQALRAIFEMPEDINPANDKTPFLNLEVQPQSQLLTATIGTDSTFSNILPFNFDYFLSRVQSIYFDHEIIGRPGAIMQLQYFTDFADDISGEFAEQLQIWIANTSEDKLNTWLPESEFTLVWNDSIHLPAGQNTIILTLQNPFIYEGQNIVIMTNRPRNTTEYSSYNLFATSETPDFESRSREYHSFAYIFNWKQPGNALNYFPNIKMGFGLAGAKVTGKVTSDGTTPVEGVTIELFGPNASNYYKRTTDADGNFSYDFLLDGYYWFKATKLGYADVTTNPMSIMIGDEREVNITLPHLPTYDLSGKVTANNMPDGVPGVEIKLSGYNTYSTITDETGNYSIPNIYATKTYNIEASKAGYTTCQSTVSIADNNVTRDIFLNEIAWGVGKPLVDIVNENAVVTWLQPGTFQERNYVLDDGTAEEAYSFGSYNGAYGNMFVVGEEGEITSVDVFGVDHEYNSDRPLTIDIYNENRELVGTSEYFVMKANEWVNVPISNIPYSGTFYAMVHWKHIDGYTYTHHLGYDLTGPGAEGNFDYIITDGVGWYVWHQMTWGEPGVFMIRPNANIYGKKVSYNVTGRIEPEAPMQAIKMPEYSYLKKTVVAPECVKPKTGEPTRAFENYIVYRLTENQPESEWVLLDDNVTETTLTDYDWEELPSNIYQYAVKVKYTGELVSVARLTNKVKNKMEFDYQIKITTNSGDPVAGAIVRLTNQDGNSAHDYTKVSGATGVTFADAWIGTYNLKITLSGHEEYTSVITISEAGQSHIAELIEIINMPDGLEIDVDCEKKEVLFGWNKYQPFFDDMESYEDFIIEDIGDYILYSSNLGSNWGIGGVSYPNKFEPHAVQVFNPSKTIPAIVEIPGLAPYSGEKYLLSFGAVSEVTDKWLILPKLRITEGEKFSFWAKTYSLDYPERIRVLVSTTGTNVFSDFKLISEGYYIELPDEWTYYSYDLSAYTRQDIHLAINIISEDGFFMMLDDITVDIDRSGAKSLTNYQVYLNGEETEITTDKEYLFTNIGEGAYTAGVKAIYSSGESQTATIQFMGCEEIGIGETNQTDLQLYPNPFTHEIQISDPNLVNSVQITDIMGQVVKNTVYNGKTITTENLSSGVYMVVIETHSGEKMIYKMVKN